MNSSINDKLVCTISSIKIFILGNIFFIIDTGILEYYCILIIVLYNNLKY